MISFKQTQLRETDEDVETSHVTHCLSVNNLANARLWNSLPHDIVASDTMSQFRCELKTFYLDSHILLFCFSSLPCGPCC